MPRANLKNAWKKLRVGDPTSDAELLALHDQATMAMRYFDDRGVEMHLAAYETIRIRTEIECYLSARGYEITFDKDLGEMVIGEKKRNAGL
jgi:hypothetical protein